MIDCSCWVTLPSRIIPYVCPASSNSTSVTALRWCTVASWCRRSALPSRDPALFHSVAGSRATITAITAQHYALFGRSYVNQQSADWIVASVDTVVSGKGVWVDRFKRSTLGIIDEGHHCLKDNKWGRCFSMLAPDSKGWLPTAPRRSDGKGLGSHSDGIADVLVEGPDMRALIDQGLFD